jgi:hypothetical protein
MAPSELLFLTTARFQDVDRLGLVYSHSQSFSSYCCIHRPYVLSLNHSVHTRPLRHPAAHHHHHFQLRD